MTVTPLSFSSLRSACENESGGPAALANAVHHATGRRIRDLPITLDKLMAEPV